MSPRSYLSYRWKCKPDPAYQQKLGPDGNPVSLVDFRKKKRKKKRWRRS